MCEILRFEVFWTSYERIIVRLPALRATRRKRTGMKRLNQKQFLRSVKKKISLDAKMSEPVQPSGKITTRQAVLKELRVQSPLTVSQLVDQTNRARSTIKKYIDELELNGFVIVERRIGRNGNVVKIASRGLADPGQGDLF